jgi:hypothetical protein
MRKTIIILSILLISSCSSRDKKPTTIEPASNGNGIYMLKGANIYFEVDANFGGRISSFKIRNKEMLSGKDIDSSNWGSTFWASPQIDSNWLPSEIIDKNVYSAEIIDDAIVLKSGIDKKSGFSVIKKFAADLKDTSISIAYTIINNSDKRKKVAPWEVTRVPAGGMLLFPSPDEMKKKKKSPLVFDDHGIAFFEHSLKKASKVVAKGSEGWMAYIYDETAFIKKFNEVSADKIEPGEGDIELKEDQDNRFLELDEKGGYAELKPGQYLEWTVKWYVRSVPQKIKIEKGNQALVNYVRTTIKQK